jgi:hypothetical protein
VPGRKTIGKGDFSATSKASSFGKVVAAPLEALHSAGQSWPVS